MRSVEEGRKKETKETQLVGQVFFNSHRNYRDPVSC